MWTNSGYHAQPELNMKEVKKGLRQGRMSDQFDRKIYLFQLQLWKTGLLFAFVKFVLFVIFKVQNRPYNSELFLEFIQNLCEKLNDLEIHTGKIIMDNASIHKEERVRDFL